MDCRRGVTMNNRSAGPMARRLTTNQEIAGSIPASINNMSTQKLNIFCFSCMTSKSFCRSGYAFCSRYLRRRVIFMESAIRTYA